MRRDNVKQIALGGVLAATAVVIMCLGGLIPIATYICPILCCMTLYVVLIFCGKRLGWTWFVVVSILSLLLDPDKEAVMIFLALGYYPLIKATIERNRLSSLLKLLFFNFSILCAYLIMIYLMGMGGLVKENMEFGVIGLVIILALGNATFLLLDKLLTIMERKIR